jgi:hypothetical protein
LDKSDNELDLLSDRNEHVDPTSPMVPWLDPEMIEVQVGIKSIWKMCPSACSDIGIAVGCKR